MTPPVRDRASPTAPGSPWTSRSGHTPHPTRIKDSAYAVDERSCSVPRADPGHGTQQHVRLGRLRLTDAATSAGPTQAASSSTAPSVSSSQDRMPENRPLSTSTSKTVAATPPKSPRCRTTSACPRSRPPASAPSPDGALQYATMHHVNTNIPLFVLFRALDSRATRDITDDAGGSPDGHFVPRSLLLRVDLQPGVCHQHSRNSMAPREHDPRVSLAST
jgi:hypothetical protein